MLSEDESNLISQTAQSPTDLEQFYTTEMSDLGFILEGTTSIGPIVELTFTREELTVSVSILPTGDMVTVTITTF